ncbi:MBL fold metallo-hydrolase [Paenibacillus humicola]|uniref:MBL fold metallo-hydrolase n=1 Tax=Paenibacillus humicola TaxID=3110540 RepID=UPI00237A2B0F|nr:MBL fold metallo-hydrolase [Paenibacillus humicola]
MQLLKRIFLACGQPYGTHPNAYAILGDEAVVLIDSGTNEAELKVIQRNLSAWGLSGYPISHLLLTHSHFDHSGNAHAFRAKGAEIAAGPGDAEGIELADERVIPYCYEETFVPCRVDRKVKDGDVIQAAGLAFEVLHVPGHSSGSVAYRLTIDGQTVLFTGDALMAGLHGEAKLGARIAADYSPDEYLRSLKRLASVEADAVLAGHYLPCLQGASGLLKSGYRTGLLELRSPHAANAAD